MGPSRQTLTQSSRHLKKIKCARFIEGLNSATYRVKPVEFSIRQFYKHLEIEIEKNIPSGKTKIKK